MTQRFLGVLAAGLIVCAALPAAATTQPPIPTPTPTADDPGGTATPTPAGACRQPPLVARAGAAPNPARSGQTVELQGIANGAGNYSYSWRQVSGAPVTIAHANADFASFETPPVASPASLVFELTVYAVGTAFVYQAAVEVTVLPPAGVAWVAVSDSNTTPDLPAAVGVRLYTDLSVARLEHDLELAPLRILTRSNGRPACDVMPELNVATAQFDLRPQGCTGTACTGVHATLTASGLLPNGAQLYRCIVAPGVAESPSCDFFITCGGEAAYDGAGQPLPAQCSGGVVRSEYPEPDVDLIVTVDPPHPLPGDMVRVSVDTAVGSGLVGIPTYRLHGADPLLAGETTRRFSTPMPFTYELDAVRAGDTQLSVSVDFETQGGCPGNSYFYFWYAQSEPFSLTVGAPNVTPSPTPSPLIPVDTEFSGVVYDAAIGVEAPIADAEIHYEYRSFGIPALTGTVHSDAAGRYRFVLPLAGGVVHVDVEAAGFAPWSRNVDTSTDLGLARLGGIVQVEPTSATLCGGTLDVTISNTGPPGETLVILRIEGDGAGFRWDFSALDLPIVLACGEQFSFPVSYDGTGQQFPSKLDVQVISGARAGSGHASYLGIVDGCEPTPTPTATAAPQRTGDLGTKQVHGRVYDAAHGVDAGMGGAEVSYIAPNGDGTVQTDDQGDFSFSLFLHDTDFITVHAGAAGFAPSEVHFGGYELWTLSMLDLGLEAIDPSHHRITGSVQRDPYCPSGSNVTVALTPLGSDEPSQMLIVPESDEFTFDDVADGDYSVSAQSDCQPSYAPPVSVSVRGADVAVEIIFDQWCPPVVVLVPARGAPGTDVEVRGRCYFIHSGGEADISFDAQLLTQVHAGTVGDYDAQIEIPADASAGPHDIRAASRSGTLIGSASFFVESGVPVPCAGDCNGDSHVSIDELIIGVRLALGFTDPACAAIDATGEGEVAIAELVAAVERALNGCQ